MQQTLLPLFDDDPAGPPAFNKQQLAARLKALAHKGVYLGGSSWKYEGWLGQIYSRERYVRRGRFAKSVFEQRCIEEYAETFPIVCGDFTFYQFPSPEFWSKLFGSAPQQLKFALKVPEEITCRTFPRLPRYGPRAGKRNPSFLDPELFDSAFLQLLAPDRERVAVLIFEFGTFAKSTYPDPKVFFAELGAFLERLPQGWRYSVEVRNPEFLHQAYFETLRAHGAAHVFTSWNRMPPLHEQIKIDEAYTADFVVARGLLRPGRSYEQAVELFKPYERVQEENPEAREAIRKLIRRAERRKELAYMFINNRLEGNTPGTIQAVVDD